MPAKAKKQAKMRKAPAVIGDSLAYDSIIGEIKKCRDEAETAWQLAMDEFYEDQEFYLSKQWDEAAEAELEAKGVPVISLNYVKKTIDMVAGYQRQNRVDLRAKPIENTDEVNAEVRSRLLKWCLSNTNYDMANSSVFKDMIISGIGWFDVSLDYSRDMLNGDIKVGRESIFDLYVDPHSTELDLSDADYIIRTKKLTRKKLEYLYPEYKEQIRQAPSAKTQNRMSKSVNVPNDRGEKVLVTEYWYKKYEKKTLIINPEDIADVKIHEGTAADLELARQGYPNAEIITKEMCIIKLAILVGDSTLVYHGDHPDKMDRFPFIPNFGFISPSYDRLEYKIQGIVRALKDPQREKNARRTQILKSIGQSIRGGFMMEKGAIDDVEELREGAGYDGIIQYNPNKKFQQITAPPIDAAAVQIEMMFKDDLQYMGANPDMLGQITERGASGLLVNMRLKQGLTTIQEVFDNHYFSLKLLGEYVLGLIDKKYTQPKIKRILGDDLPFAQQKRVIMEQIKAIGGQAQQLTMQGRQFEEQLAQKKMQTKQQLDGIRADFDQATDPVYKDGVYMAGQEMMTRAGTEEAQIQQQRQGFVQQQQAIMTQVQVLQQTMAELEAKEAEFWDSYEKTRNTARYDIVIDETVSSPTFRHSALQALMQGAQYQIPIPPESIIELMELPKSVKEKILEQIEQNKQMQQQMVQMQQQGAQSKAQNRQADAQAKQGAMQ